jgi:hypothetical protein
LRRKTLIDKVSNNSLAASPAVSEPEEVQIPVCIGYPKSNKDHPIPAGMGWLTGFYPEDGGCRLLQYVCNALPDYTASITKNIFIVTTIRNSYVAQLSENSQSCRLKVGV